MRAAISIIETVDGTILIRTPRGQLAVLDDDRVGAPHARLHRMVNSYTSLNDLVAHLGVGHDSRSVVGDLIDDDLVASVGTQHPDRGCSSRRYGEFMRTRDALNLESEAFAIEAERVGSVLPRDPLAGLDE